MKLLYFTDPHLTAKSPASRQDVYYLTTFKKLMEIGEIAKTESADMIVCGGDLFHSPVVSLNYAGKIARILKSWGKPILVVPGNHDVYGYNVATINQTMLGMFAQTGIVRLLTKDSPIKVQLGTRLLALEGREYSNVLDDSPANYQPIINTADFNIVVNHGMLLDKEYIPGVPYTKTSDVEFPADITIGGHYHYGFPEHQVNGGMFFNPGSLLRTEASKGNKTFVPKLLLFDLTDGTRGIEYTYKYIPLTSAEDANVIFDYASVQEKKEASQLLEQFKQFVTNTSSVTTSASVEDMIQQVGQDNGIDTQIIDEALDRIQQAHTGEVDSLQARGFVEHQGKIFITKLTVRNFQSHVDTSVDFVEGFNVIVGETNSGKTSLLRALQWVLYNEPKGSDFIRTGSDSCSVTLDLSNGFQITRERTRNGAGSYVIVDDKGATQTYQGFGNDIPIEIFNAHQMPLVELSKGLSTSLNISSQLEGPFLLSMNPSEKANAIGRIIGSQILDGAIKEVSKDVGNTTKEISSLKKQRETKETQLKTYDYLPAYLNRITEAEILVKATEDIEEEVTELTNLKAQYEEASRQINRLKDDLQQYRRISEKTTELQVLKSLTQELEQHQRISEAYDKIMQEIVMYENTLSSGINRLVAEEDLQQTKSLLVMLLALWSLYEAYNEAYNKVRCCESEVSYWTFIAGQKIQQAKDLLTALESLTLVAKEYEKATTALNVCREMKSERDEVVRDLTQELTSARAALRDFLIKQGSCPVCSRPMDDHTIEHIIEEGR